MAVTRDVCGFNRPAIQASAIISDWDSFEHGQQEWQCIWLEIRALFCHMELVQTFLPLAQTVYLSSRSGRCLVLGCVIFDAKLALRPGLLSRITNRSLSLKVCGVLSHSNSQQIGWLRWYIATVGAVVACYASSVIWSQIWSIIARTMQKSNVA